MDLVLFENQLKKLNNATDDLCNEIASKFIINLDLDFSNYITEIFKIDELFANIDEFQRRTVSELIKIPINEDECNNILRQIQVCEKNYALIEKYGVKIFNHLFTSTGDGLLRIIALFQDNKGESPVEAHTRWVRFENRMQGLALFYEYLSKFFHVCFDDRKNSLEQANNLYEACINAEYSDKDYSLTLGWYDNYRKFGITNEGKATLLLKIKNNKTSQSNIDKEKTSYQNEKKRLSDYKRNCLDYVAQRYWKEHKDEHKKLLDQLDLLKRKKKQIESDFNKKIQDSLEQNSELERKVIRKFNELKSLSVFKIKARSAIKREINNIQQEIVTMKKNTDNLKNSLKNEISVVDRQIGDINYKINNP